MPQNQDAKKLALEAARKKIKDSGVRLGDKVALTDSTVMTFVKLNRTKFLVKNDHQQFYDAPLGMFIEVVERAPIDYLLEAIKQECRKWFGQEIQTSWGPSSVKGFDLDESHVELLEFGEELYHLKLDDFLMELVTNADAKINLYGVDPAAKYRVELLSVGNPDVGQNPNHQKYDAQPNRTVGVNTLQAASETCQAFIKDNELGASHWAGGNVYDNQTGLQVAHVSYNGRVWAPDMMTEISIAG